MIMAMAMVMASQTKEEQVHDVVWSAERRAQSVVRPSWCERTLAREMVGWMTM